MRYFVSGHRDLTKEEFKEHYVPLIIKVLREDSWAEFVVGDWEGCDTFFVDIITSLRLRPLPNIDIYCVEKPRLKPRGYSIDCYENIHYYSYNDYDECDASMTRDSDFDIAWIRPGRENSHTANNIKRRYNL